MELHIVHRARGRGPRHPAVPFVSIARVEVNSVYGIIKDSLNAFEYRIIVLRVGTSNIAIHDQ